MKGKGTKERKTKERKKQIRVVTADRFIGNRFKTIMGCSTSESERVVVSDMTL